jgi:hypothetical protein
VTGTKINTKAENSKEKLPIRFRLLTTKDDRHLMNIVNFKKEDNNEDFCPKQGKK